MPLERFSNNFSTTLSAAATNTATTLSLTTTAGLTASTTAPATQTRLMNARTGEIVIVTNVASATSVTVTRGAEGTTAAAMDAGDQVVQVVTRDGLLSNPAPGGLRIAIPTGTSTYTPNLAVKYHFLDVSGSTSLTIAAPVAGPVPVEIGDEIRFHFAVGATAWSAQPTWHATYWRSPAFSASLTANTGSSVSFAYRGGGIAATNAWVRIN